MFLSMKRRIEVARQYYDDRSAVDWSRIEWIIRNAGERLNGRVLFFGSGYNSMMWSQVCDAVFLEDNRHRYRKLFEPSEHQHLVAYLLNYGTRVGNWRQDLAANVVNTLPPEIERQNFDAIIVDGPKGKYPKDPERTR